MKEIFLKAIPYDKKLVTLGLESGVDAVIVEKDKIDEVLSLGRIKVYPQDEFEVIKLTTKEDEERAGELLQEGKKVLIQKDWEIIPIENLLAIQKGKLGVEVENIERARLASGILERGVDFLVILPEGKDAIKEIVRELKISCQKVELTSATITDIKPVGLGHRVCVDTCSILKRGQGLLVGNSSSFTFLVHAETEENPYVAARPFRVNAGAAHLYVMLPDDKTSYLEELKSGKEVLIVDYKGNTMRAVVGRAKIEIRPLLLICAEAEGKKGEVVLQNAETIRLVKEDGSPISVASLKKGDKVLVKIDEAGRHFGMKVKEEIEER